ncbi:spore germination protein [Paenibacillus sp. N4]|uniref:spore germination protein n=1 Tax=Paenibacillus vietnamensis TaxID=2590547 RepID=UPI001CD0D22B|nr:spore germination protein [Paenibacillus vietnamensis]MCA0756091.1 spore germination protein [Paenibacillus vietnamensis]
MGYGRRLQRAKVNINIKNINVTTMSGSASFNVGDFAVIDPISSQNTATENFNSNNNFSRTTTTQHGGAGAFNTGNNNKFVTPFNRINDLGNGGNGNLN